MDAKNQKLRWGVEQRLEFIEYCLFWEGSVNRSDIISRFGVSVPQASKDLAQYQEIAPDNLEYDRRAKCYIPNRRFQPRYLEPDAEGYLNELVKQTNAPADLLSTIEHLQADTIPELARQLDPEILRILIAASRDRTTAEILYQSMNPKRSDPVWRSISPHSFGSDGMRWHVRAFCHVDQMFKDFLISRCLQIKPGTASNIDPESDRLWNEKFHVVLIPNPQLSAEQQAVIAADYGMEKDRLAVLVRKSFLFYFLRRYRLDLIHLIEDPRENPLIIQNRKEFDEILNGTNA